MNDQPIRFDDGAAYEHGMGVYSRLVGETFLAWLSPPPRLRWVDIGCGNGAFTELLCERTDPAEVEGIDPSEAQIAFARRRSGAARARFRPGDAMALPFEDGRFDAAVMALVLFFVPDPAKGLAEMKRVVRPGGSLSAYVWDVPGGGLPIEPVREALRELQIEPASPPSFAVSSLPALRAAFVEAGLAEVETTSISVERDFEDFDAYWTAALMVGSLAERMATLPPDVVDDARARTRRHLRVKADGRVTGRGTANAVRGLVPRPGA